MAIALPRRSDMARSSSRSRSIPSKTSLCAERCARADDERDARAINETAEIVAAKLVGTEHMRPAAPLVPNWWQQALGEILSKRIIRGEPWREQRQRKHQRPRCPARPESQPG